MAWNEPGNNGGGQDKDRGGTAVAVTRDRQTSMRCLAS